MLRSCPAATRVVLVEPDARAAGRGRCRRSGWPAALGHRGRRPAARGCTADRRAGRGRRRPHPLRALGGLAATPRSATTAGVVRVDFRVGEFVLAGSADPFRADRIGEHDNAELAVDLLSAKPTLVWLDLHAPEPKPKTAARIGAGQPLPSLRPGRRARSGATPARARRPSSHGAGAGEWPRPARAESRSRTGCSRWC